MVISWLGLKNFRNYQTLEFDLQPTFNLFYGANGQGKTNLIEALYLLTHLRSYRTARLKPLIKSGEAQAKVSAVIFQSQVTHQVSLDLFSQNKRVYLDQKPLQYSSDYIKRFFSLVFAPDLLSRFKEVPGERRGFFDRALCLLDSGYMLKLKEFNRIKAQKNRNLKSGTRKTISSWNQLLAQVIGPIVEARDQLVEELNQILAGFYRTFCLVDGQLQIRFRADCIHKNPEEILNLLEQKREAELDQGFCLLGPHKDNYMMTMETKIDRLGFSQGEYRLAFLALLLSLNQIFKERLKYQPLLLFDDLFSELDRQSCVSLMAYFKTINNQIVVTSTEVPEPFKLIKGQLKVEKAQFVNPQLIT